MASQTRQVARADSESAPIPSSSGTLLHIQALRALAVALVVVYHFWPHRLSGGYVGVDVFFVISGYLITAHLVREIRATGGVRLSVFWARRIRRLLPASLVVIAVSAIVTAWLVPQAYWQQYMREFAASALYVENWVLAGDAVDYLAAGNTASPVQHFWSLSVEEQFYVAWPLLLVLGVAMGRRFFRPAGGGRPIVVVLAAIFAASAAYSLYLTSANPDVAYFSTFTRAWEFAAGGLLAVVGARYSLPARLGAAVSWMGLAAIVVAALTFSDATPFPGYVAALPVAGAVAFIAAREPHRASPHRWLEARWIQWLGDASYSVYLWHWPLLVLIPFALGFELTWPLKLAALGLTLGAAAATKVLIEDRFRRPRDSGDQGVPSDPRIGRVYAFAAAGMVGVIALAGAGWWSAKAQVAAFDEAPGATAGSAQAECFGAASLDPILQSTCADVEWESLSPPRVAIGADVPAAFGDECRTGPEDAELKPCEYGNPDSDFWVVLVGDSHAAQWAPAFESAAQDNDWRLTVFYKAACAFTDAADRNRSEAYGPSCLEWNDGVMKWLEERDAPDVVATSAVRNHAFLDDAGEESAEVAIDGFARRYEELAGRGSDVVAIVDNPQLGEAEIACVADGTGLSAECGRQQSDALSRADYLTPATQGIPGAHAIDLTEYFCEDGYCPGVVGSVAVYRDTSSHLTRTYVTSLTPYLLSAMSDAGVALARVD